MNLITICTRNNKEYFGKIKNDILDKSYIGNIVEKYWQDIPNHFENIDLDEFVIMPNHIHGIIIINSVETSIYRVSKNADILTCNGYKDKKREERNRENLNREDQNRDAINRVCTESRIDKDEDSNFDFDADSKLGLKENNPMHHNSLSRIIRWFKGRVTYEVNKLNKIYFGWHPRFHDHIIRNHQELDRIQEYMINNPMNWKKDKNYKLQ